MILRRRIVAPIAWMGVLWFLSSLPSGAEGSLAGITLPAVMQNGAHAIVFAILAAAWFWALGTDAPGIPRAVAALSLGYGVIDELHQAFVPGRTTSFLDLCVDGLGIAFVVWMIRRRRPAPNTAVLSSGSLSQ